MPADLASQLEPIGDRTAHAGDASGRDGGASGRGGSARGGDSVREGGGGPKKSAAEEMAERAERMKRLLDVAKVASAQDREILGSSDIHKSDIRSVKVLGEGAFGIVDLVVVDAHANGILLCVRKKLLKRSEKNNSDPEMEVQFMKITAGCEFVVQCWSSVEGLYDMTLLLEYCPYGSLENMLNIASDLRSRSCGCWDFVKDRWLNLSRRSGLKESEARFYIGCIILGVQSMHEKGLLHRDLKPANCLIAENRYIKVGDLGLTKALGKEGKGYNKAGTPGYMAPEVYYNQGKGKTPGYRYAADVWSLGIILWEMMDGVPPRWSPLSWYWTTLHFPDHFSPSLRSLLQGMLQKSPKDRIDTPAIKAHEWFSGFDWEALAAQALVAPDPPEYDFMHIHKQLEPNMPNIEAVM